MPISEKLRKLLAQFSVMRHEDKRDMLLPKGKSFYNQVPSLHTNHPRPCPPCSRS